MRIPSISVIALFALATATAACSAETAPASASKDNKATGEDKANKSGADDDDKTKTDDSDKSETKDDKPVTESTEDPGLKDYLWPPKINTGFTGGAEVFKVPLDTDLTGTLTWTVADPTIAEVTTVAAPKDYEDAKKADPDKVPDIQFAMLTTKKAGSTTIKVSNGTKNAESPLTVKEYTSAAFTIGQTRYKTGGTEENRKPCAGCHEKPDGADHSPGWLALFKDDDVLSAVQTAVYAEDKYLLNEGAHKWNLTDEEKTGIMAYLRGLPPRGF